MNRSFTSRSEEETLRLAERLAKRLRPGKVVALSGEIGSGKTLFIKGLCRGLDVRNSDEVKSPTFVLLHFYQGKFAIQHFDLYRLQDERELETIGFDEFLSSREALSVVEWADRAPGRIPPDALWVNIKIVGTCTRKIVIRKGR